MVELERCAVEDGNDHLMLPRCCLRISPDQTTEDTAAHLEMRAQTVYFRSTIHRPPMARAGKGSEEDVVVMPSTTEVIG